MIAKCILKFRNLIINIKLNFQFNIYFKFMDTIDKYNIFMIKEYLYPYEQVCLKFVNKYIYEVFNKNLNCPDNLEKIPKHILHWLVINLNVTKKFQISYTKILCEQQDENNLYDSLINKNFIFDSVYFLGYCLSYNISDFFIDYLLNKKVNFNLNTISLSLKTNDKYVLKWCLKNKNLCTDYISDIENALINIACANDTDELDCIKYLLKHNYYFDFTALNTCITHNNIKVFDYLIKKIKYDFSFMFCPNNLFMLSITQSNIRFIKYIYKEFSPLIEDRYLDTLLMMHDSLPSKETKKCIEWFNNYL